MRAQFIHERVSTLGVEAGLFPLSNWKKLGIAVAAKGGATTAILRDSDDAIVAEGYARCSQLDNFNRERGRQIALGRALKAAGLPSRGVIVDFQDGGQVNWFAA